MSEFHLHGPVPLSSVAYVEREFEQRTFQELLAGRWVLLLGPRQHGKTTGLFRVKQKLAEAGISSALVDLQRLPPHKSYSDMLRWVAGRILYAFDRQGQLTPPNDENELADWLSAVVPRNSSPFTVIIDEASAISDDERRNAFYGQIRSISSDRAENASHELAGRIRFVFAGTFRPETLVHERNSPFNICEKVETDDLSSKGAAALWRNVMGPEEPEDYVVKAYDLVGGQTYLLQRLFYGLQGAEAGQWDTAFAEQVEELRSGADNHFMALFGRVFMDLGLTEILRRMVINYEVPNEPASPDFRYLQVLGIARRDGNRLIFRNQLYSEFAASAPQLTDGNSPALSKGAPPNIVPPQENACDFMTDSEFQEITLSAYRAAVLAYNQRSYRIALVGFGMALEAALTEWLLTLSATELGAKVANARTKGLKFSRFESSTDVSSWRLATLEEVARAKPAPSACRVEVPAALRSYRNLVHPSLLKSQYLDEASMEPDARSASGMLESVLRDIRAVHR